MNRLWRFALCLYTPWDNLSIWFSNSIMDHTPVVANSLRYEDKKNPTKTNPIPIQPNRTEVYVRWDTLNTPTRTPSVVVDFSEFHFFCLFVSRFPKSDVKISQLFTLYPTLHHHHSQGWYEVCFDVDKFYFRTFFFWVRVYLYSFVLFSITG